MAPSSALTTQQVSVLKWIGDGHPEQIPPDYSLRISARALERRDLVRISGHGPSWAANLTDKGRRALNNPEPSVSSSPSPGSPMETALPRSQAAPTASQTTQKTTGLPGPKPIPAAKPRPKSDDLLAALLANGTVRFEPKQYQSVQAQVSYLNRKGLVPKEKVIEVRGPGWGSESGKITLSDRPAWQYQQLDDIDIPTSLRNPSDAVLTMQRRGDQLDMSEKCFRHALLIVQAISTTCTQRGYRIKARDRNQYDWMNGPGYKNDPDYAGHIEVGIRENTFVLALSQENAQAPTSREARTNTAKAAEQVKTRATVRIRILGSRRSFWRSEWTESKDGTGIEFLPRLFQELELRAQRADDERRDEEEKRIRTRREWEAVKLRARALFIRDKKLELLYDQLHRRKLVTELEVYLDELQVRLTDTDDRFRPNVSEWVEWVSTYKDEIDPRHGPLALPGIQDPSDSDIAPYTDDWSTSGPYKSPRSEQTSALQFPLPQPWHPNRREWP
jgi:hypothetical protein